MFLMQFGKGAANKEITANILNLPKSVLKEFLQGYIDSDGCKQADNLFSATTVSEKLAYGLSQVVAKVYDRPTRIYKIKTPKTRTAFGRKIVQKQQYLVAWKTTDNKQDKAFVANGFVWHPINSVEKHERLEVFDIEVERDHTFIANNCIVSNCQSFSLAGKREGAEKGSGTESALIWEIVRYLDNYKERECLPKYLLLENVKGLVTEKFMPFFLSWLDLLKEYGYNNYWEVQNAKGFNVPQNRERVMVVSIRKDVDDGYFRFPETRPCAIRLKDVLEKEVDKKYYISQRAIDGMMNWKSREQPLDNVGVEREVCKTLTARGAGEMHSGMVVFGEEIEEPVCFAMRGRNPENPSDRAAGKPTKQRLEKNTQGTTNTLTTVSKDNLIGEPVMLAPDNWSHKAGDGQSTRKRRETDIVPALQAQAGHTQQSYVREPICLNSKVDGKQPSIHSRIYDPSGVATAQLVGLGGRYNIAEEIKKEEVAKRAGELIEALDIKDGFMYAPYSFAEIKEVAPTQTTNCGGVRNYGAVVKFEELEKKSKKEVYVEKLLEANDYEDGDMIQHSYSNREISDPKGQGKRDVSMTLTTRVDCLGIVEKTDKKKIGCYEKDGKYYRVRKLTPRESWRLMGWEDHRIDLVLNAKDDKGKRLVSDSAMYFLAGNSIVVQHLMGIFGQLLRVPYKKKVWGSVENPYKEIDMVDMIHKGEYEYDEFGIIRKE